MFYPMNNNIFNKKFTYTYCSVCLYLVMLNVLVYFAVGHFKFSVKGVPLIYWLGLVPQMVKHGFVWQFVSYMFVHVDFTHLLFNMYALLMFGMSCERFLGSREFLLFYLVTGVLGGILSSAVNTAGGMSNVMILGASGPIYGLLFLISVLFPDSRILLFFFIPMKMPLAVMIFMLIEVLSQVFGTSAGISHLVHLSSIAIAWIYCLVRFRISPAKVWRESFRK